MEEELSEDLWALRRWLKDRSIKLSDKQVGRILMILGYTFPRGTRELRRAVLVELADSQDVVVTYAKTMQKCVGHRLNKHSLQKLILENPEMGWPEFQRSYGDEMPTVTANSFYFTRSHLKSQGHELPSLCMAS